MPTPSFPFRWIIVAVVALTGLGRMSGAEAPSADESARVEALRRRHLDAIGSAEARAKVSTRRATGWIERNQAKIPFVRSQRAPNQLHAETRFPRPGTLTQGFDGKTGWMLHPQQGGKVLTGQELAATAAASWFNPSEHLREMFAIRRWGGARTVEGRAMLTLELAVRPGEPVETWFFDATTARLERIEKMVDGGSQGLVPVTMVFEDYRATDGLMLAYRVRTRLGATETVAQFEKIEHGVAFPADFFKAPF